jgi:trehalose-6-phosphate synthase
MIIECGAKYEEIDQQYAQRLLALVDTGDTVMVV